METAAVDVLNRSQAGAYWKKCYGWKQAPGGVGGICRASFRFLVTAESVRSSAFALQMHNSFQSEQMLGCRGLTRTRVQGAILTFLPNIF